MRVKNYVIRDIDQMLSLLSQKRLTERDNEKRVATLCRRFAKAKKHIDEQHAEIIQRYPAPSGWEDRDLPIAVIEVRQHEYNTLMEEEQELRDIPAALYLTENDLPKIMKGELGDENRIATSMIMAKLHFLYDVKDDDEEPLVDGKDGTPVEG